MSLRERGLVMETLKDKKKDPVCGMEVDPDSALMADRAGVTYYFCSEKCRTEFESERFVLHHGGKKPDSCCGS